MTINENLTQARQYAFDLSALLDKHGINVETVSHRGSFDIKRTSTKKRVIVSGNVMVHKNGYISIHIFSRPERSKSKLEYITYYGQPSKSLSPDSIIKRLDL